MPRMLNIAETISVRMANLTCLTLFTGHIFEETDDIARHWEFLLTNLCALPQRRSSQLLSPATLPLEGHLALVTEAQNVGRQIANLLRRKDEVRHGRM